MDATQERWCEADVHRVRGQLLIAASDDGDKLAYVMKFFEEVLSKMG